MDGRVSASNFPIVYRSFCILVDVAIDRTGRGGPLFSHDFLLSCAALRTVLLRLVVRNGKTAIEDLQEMGSRSGFFSGGCFCCFYFLTFFCRRTFFQCAIPCYADRKAFVNASYCHSYCAEKKLNSVRLSASASGFFLTNTCSQKQLHICEDSCTFMNKESTKATRRWKNNPVFFSSIFF